MASPMPILFNAFRSANRTARPYHNSGNGCQRWKRSDKVSRSTESVMSVNQQTPAASPTLDLFLASFLALFLEVVFIRWVPSYERVLAYFTNFVLIASFLGLGLGAMLARRRWELIRCQPLLILLLVGLAILFNR